jgi:glycosyltransferase involved in cell wall biosynthesis
MFGPTTNYPGGMTEVVRSYAAAGIFEHWPLRYIPTFAGHDLAGRLRPWLRALITLLVHLARRRVALVHAHSAAYGSFWRKSVLCALAAAFRVPYVIHLHDGRLGEFYDGRCNSLARFWVRLMLRNAARVVVVTARWRDVVSRIEPAAQLAVIGNPIVSPDALPLPERPARTVLFLAWLQEEKGVLDLVRAIPMVLRAVPEARFVLAGEGRAPIVDLARSLGVEHALTLPGWVEGRQKEELLRRSDLFVLPSHYEGLPLGLLEAMGWGLPVIATPVGGIPDLIADHVNGLLVAPGEPPALAKAIVLLLKNDVQRGRLRDAALRDVRERYGIATIIAALEALYQELGVPVQRPVYPAMHVVHRG